MITINNYIEKTQNISFSSLPEALKKETIWLKKPLVTISKPITATIPFREWLTIILKNSMLT
jgi:hypothetical protein